MTTHMHIFKRLRATAGQGPNYVGPSCGDVGLCWPILRAMLAQLGAMLAHLGGYVGPSWGFVGPSWGLCWPILRLCWPILRPMLAHLRCLCKNMLNVTGPKNTVNYRGFCRHAHPTARSAEGAAAPLSYGEERTAYGNGRNFYQYRMLWERLELKGVRGKGIAGGVFLSLSLLPLSVGLRCGIIVVARIRRNFCQYGMWTGTVHGRTD